MTPEQRAATVANVRRVLDGEDGATVYGCRDWQTFYRADKGLLLRDYLAEHPADDDAPASVNDVEEAFGQDSICAIFDDSPVYNVGLVKIQTRGQLRRLRAALEGK